MAKFAGDARPQLAWKGELHEFSLPLKVLSATTLVVMCLTLAFTQLGFLGLGETGHFSAYAVPMLVPVALAALLFGTLGGALVGLLAGTVLYIHALVMPLGYYELAFVTPFTSIVMLSVAGLLMGLLFKRALRGNPPLKKRIIRIVLVCCVVSLIYSIAFAVGSVLQLFNYVSTIVDEEFVREESEILIQEAANRFIFQIGDFGLQLGVNSLIVSAICVGVDCFIAWVKTHEVHVRLRTRFNSWLAVATAIVFMVMEGWGFYYITEGERASEMANMMSEASYLVYQLDNADYREESLFRLLDDIGFDYSELSDSGFEDFIDTVRNYGLLSGYTEEDDGIIIISSYSDNLILLANTPRFAPTESGGDSFLEQFLDRDALDAIERSIETGEPQRIIYRPAVSSVFGEDTVRESLFQTEIGFLFSRRWNNYVVTVMRPASMVFKERGRAVGWSTASIALILIVVFSITSILLDRVVAKPIDDTNAVLARITSGDLDARVDVGGTFEFETLSHDINATVDALRGWIAEAESRMDADLAASKAIQESALPSTFPPFPDIPRFDIYAYMDPAREVGGDFYDFFLLGDSSGRDEGRLGFLIADVSGKSIPAALFMMKAKTLIHDYLANGVELGEAVENANHLLCDGNDANMFVTAWVAVLDYGTGHIDYVNAGHNPPLLWTSDEDDPDPSEPRYARPGAWQWLKKKSGIPLGMYDGLPYKTHSLDLKPGDMLLLYTDGVTEAMDPEENLYGDPRLEELVEAASALRPRMLVTAVEESVAEFARGAEQFDDITILALEYGVPPEVTATITVPAKVEELHHVNEFIHSALDQRFCPQRVQNLIDIAVEEIFVNVASYAYPEATDENPGAARISYTYSPTPPSIVITIADDGIPFDPLAVPDEKIPRGTDPMELRIGGLGILMAQKSVDEMSYERYDESNVVTLVKRW